MGELTLFLAGDVMTGRGIDQVLPSPGDPALREQLMRDARGYVALAESVNGAIPGPVPASWPWGDVLTVLEEAQRPAVVTVGRRRRVVVHAVGTESSGVPPGWAATTNRGGVAFVPELSASAADALATRVRRSTRPSDVVVVSVHAGSNWGYGVRGRYARFARRLVDGGVDVVHGHSSHHPRPVEVYRGRPILYGCGDLINDYEGIGGFESFRSDLRLVYLVTLDADTHELTRVRMVPMRARRLRLERVTGADAVWLQQTMARICRKFGTAIELGADESLLARAADDRR